MTRQMTYDPKCFALAAVFLADCPHIATPEHAHMLAWLIQQTIEDYLEAHRPREAKL